MKSIKSAKFSICLVLLVQIIQLTPVAPLNSYISDYRCSYPDHIMFICSGDAKKDLSVEIRAAPAFGRCSPWHPYDSSIRRVNFTACDLPKLPDGLLHFANLMHLDLSSISLEWLTTGDFQKTHFIGQFDHRTLNLSSNRLTQLNESVFSPFDQLQVLDLSNNRLQTLSPNAFVGLHRLLALNLQRNNISHIPAEAFAELRELVTVDLSHNNFTALSRSFGGRNSFRRLDLSFNHIAAVKVGDFAELHQLEHLNLASCQVAHIDDGSFAPLASLKTLDLSGNLLKGVDANLFSSAFNALESVHLDGGQLIRSEKSDKNAIDLAGLVVNNDQFNCTYWLHFSTAMGVYHVDDASFTMRAPNTVTIACTVIEDQLYKEMPVVKKAHVLPIQTNENIKRGDVEPAKMHAGDESQRTSSTMVAVLVLVLFTMALLVGVAAFRNRRALFAYRSSYRNEFRRVQQKNDDSAEPGVNSHELE